MMLEAARSLAGMLLVSALLSAGNLCINASKEDGRVPYMSVTATFLIEALKLLLMLAAIAVTRTAGPPRMTLRESVVYAAPSLLYMLDNNLNYVILRFLDPATLAVLWNLKILTTAVLFRLVLKRELSELRKVAIVLLLLGVVTSQSDKQGAAASASDDNGNRPNPRDFAIGVVLALIGATISSCASIATEWAFKRKSNCPFLWQNVMLYSYGMLFNGLMLLAKHEEITTRGFFHGYNRWTVAVVAVNSVRGISTGLILKFLDNIAGVYSHAGATLLTMLFSMLFLDFSPSLEFACGLSVVVISTYLYHLKAEVKDPRSPDCSSPSSSTKSTDCDSIGQRLHDKLQVVVVDGLQPAKKRYKTLPTASTA